MVTVKLKDGELRARRRETSLEAALEHMSFLNKAAQRPNGREEKGSLGWKAKATQRGQRQD